jgi:hypothetical protein
MAARITTWIKTLLIAEFLIVIWLPLADNVLDLDPVPAPQEKRNLALRPDWPKDHAAFDAYPEKFDAFYNDHFGFRNALIFVHNLIRWKCFDHSTSARVLVGKDPWLFYKGRRVIDYHRGLFPFKREDLEAWRRAFEERRDWCRNRGIEFAVLFAPNKHSIYPEYLPDRIRPLRDVRRLDQLLSYMKTHSDVLVIDVRAELLKAKEKERLYHWTDSHWNDRGSFRACQVAIDRLRALFPALRPYDESLFVRTSNWEKGWGLAIQLGLQDVIREEKLILKPRDGWPRLELITEGLVPPKGRSFEGEPPFALEQEMDEGIDVVVFRDSFFTNLTKYFAPHFRRSVYYWQYDFDIDVIEHEKPDLVLQEILERELIRLEPVNHPGMKRP